jgi:hypothetical protein
MYSCRSRVGLFRVSKARPALAVAVLDPAALEVQNAGGAFGYPEWGSEELFEIFETSNCLSQRVQVVGVGIFLGPRPVVQLGLDVGHENGHVGVLQLGIRSAFFLFMESSKPPNQLEAVSPDAP